MSEMFQHFALSYERVRLSLLNACITVPVLDTAGAKNGQISKGVGKDAKKKKKEKAREGERSPASTPSCFHRLAFY